MLPNGGYFNRFLCPDAKSGGCSRPYCHYGGHTSESLAIISENVSSFSASYPGSNGTQQLDTEANGDSVTDTDVPSYSTVPSEYFQGYQGYFARSSSPPPAVPKRPLLPTPAIVPISPTRPARQLRPRIQNRPRQQGSPPRKPAPSQKPQPESNLNTLARDLAVINNEIERLQRKLADSSDQTIGSGDDMAADNDSTVDDVPGYDPEEPAAKRTRYTGGHDSASSTNATDSSSEERYRPQASSKTSAAAATSTYKPTPIGELRKLERPRNKLLKDSWIVDNCTKVKKTVVSSKKSVPKEKTLLAKPVALLEKKKVTKKPSGAGATVSDLFGDDSDSEPAMSAQDRRGAFSKKSMSSKSKEDMEDMDSIIEDLIAPTSTATSQRREKAQVAKRESIGDNGLPRTKKRVAQLSNSSVEAAKKLREAGGERPKGHLMTPRQQLESRMAQYTRIQEEMMKKHRDGDGGRRKQQLSRSVKSVKQTAQDGNGKEVSVLSRQTSSSDIGTHPKGEKRVARVPKPADTSRGSSGGRPMLAIEVGAKVPTSVRQQYLNLIIDEFLRFLSEQEAYQQALEEERAVYAKAASKPGYLNAIANTIKRIREISASSLVSSDTQTKKAAPAIAISHNAVIGGKPATKHSYTVGRSGGGARAASGQPDRRISSNFSTEEFYEALLPFVLSMEQQASNGYPRPDSQKPGCAVYMKDEIKKMYVDDEELKRICIRCGKLFLLTPDGEYVWRDDCIFHWGRAWKKRVAGMVESRYTCCQEDLNSAGCSVSRYHVSDCMPRRALSEYIRTSDSSSGSLGSEAKVYALDCEMVYTTCGNELARVTVVDDQCQVVYERCVRPENTILDYNTRFSGLTEDLLLKNDAAISLVDVQNDLSRLFTSESILIGHSLESDFRALKLIHDKVVDTSVVFPHRLGAPYKRALKTLAVEFLKKIIQDDVDGHDSKQDAITCMDLMKWRVKQEKR